MLGDAEQLRTEYMLTEQDNLIDEQEFFSASDLTVRIRYRSKPIPCTVKGWKMGGCLYISCQRHRLLHPVSRLYSILEGG